MRKDELVPLERDGEPPTMMRGIREGFSWVLAHAADAARARDRHRRQHRRLQLPRDPAAARLRHARGRAGGVRDPLRLLRRAARSSGRCSRRRSGARAGRCSCSAPAASASRCSRSRRWPSVWACAVLLFVTGVCFTLWTSNANSILQLGAPDHLRGRVVSLYLWAFAGLAPDRRPARRLALEVGGTQLSFAVAGVTGLAMTALAARRRVQCASTVGGAAMTRVEQRRRAQPRRTKSSSG